MGLILPRWISFCPEYHLQSLFFNQPLHTPFGNMYKHKTPPTPPQNTPFPGLNLKVGKTHYSLGKWNPFGQIVRKVDKTFLEVGKKNYSLWQTWEQFCVEHSLSNESKH